MVIKHFYETSYHNLNFIRIWPEKLFLKGGLGSSSIISDWHKVIPTFVEITGEKLVGWGLFAPLSPTPSWIGLIQEQQRA